MRPLWPEARADRGSSFLLRMTMSLAIRERLSQRAPLGRQHTSDQLRLAVLDADDGGAALDRQVDVHRLTNVGRVRDIEDVVVGRRGLSEEPLEGLGVLLLRRRRQRVRARRCWARPVGSLPKSNWAYSFARQYSLLRTVPAGMVMLLAPRRSCVPGRVQLASGCAAWRSWPGCWDLNLCWLESVAPCRK